MGHCFNDQRHTITGLLSCAGRLHDDWSADYRMYDDVDNPRLFEPILQRIGHTTPAEDSLILSVDDTLLKKTGRQVAMAGWYRDPLGPAFHTNLIYALKMAQMRNRVRVASAPVVALAAYAALALAGHETFSEGRNPMHLQTGRWQRRERTSAYRTSDLRKQLYSEAALHHVDAFRYQSPRIERSSAIA